jgi:hypothetical protein
MGVGAEPCHLIIEGSVDSSIARRIEVRRSYYARRRLQKIAYLIG